MWPAAATAASTKGRLVVQNRRRVEAVNAAVGRHRQRARGRARRRHRCEYERSPRRAESPPRRGRERCGRGASRPERRGRAARARPRCTGGSHRCKALTLRGRGRSVSDARKRAVDTRALRRKRWLRSSRAQTGVLSCKWQRQTRRTLTTCCLRRPTQAVRVGAKVDSAAKRRQPPKKLLSTPPLPKAAATNAPLREATPPRAAQTRCARPTPRARGSTRRRRRLD